ncbi:MAG: peroxidase family protein [Steroidobacteraceae bacterium]
MKTQTKDAAASNGCPVHQRTAREGFSRRGFLSAIGATGALGPSICMMGAGHAATARAPVIREDRFGRLFPGLPPFSVATPQLAQALMEIGKPGGIMDAKDPLESGPVLLITDPALRVNNPDNTTHTAGTTFFGQFIDHDVTFDLGSQLGVPTRPEDSTNSRSPSLDLDSVYGGGPTRSPQLYGRRSSAEPLAGIKFIVEHGGMFEDLPRTPSGTAIIADPRNDEHIILAGLHAAFLLFHNNAVDAVAARDRRLRVEEIFAHAQRLTRWHYQWMIVHEFLPLVIGASLVNDILRRGPRFYRPSVGFMPVEFQGACYRMGHSMVRPSYRANLAGNNGAPFFAFVFDPSQEGALDPGDLRGGVRAPRRFVGWQTFFDFGDGNVRPNKRLDTTLSTPLFHLPRSAIAGEGGPISLPQRNLLRHITWSLPSGQSIARAMGVPVLSVADLQDLRGLGLNLDRSTPLFFYILREAHLMAEGNRLGPVAGRIVGEVLLGLLRLNRNSYLASNPNWRPTLLNRFGEQTDDFKLVDFLSFAGVSPAQRGQ